MELPPVDDGLESLVSIFVHGSIHEDTCTKDAGLESALTIKWYPSIQVLLTEPLHSQYEIKTLVANTSSIDF